jgi:hypothetical protein
MKLPNSTKLHRKSGYVLGYFQPSLRDWFRYTLIADLFSASAIQIGRIEKSNLDNTDFQPSLRD